MDFVFIISWKTHFEQSDWAVGYCKWCGGYEAVRIGRKVTVVTLYHLIRVGRSVVQGVSCCDRCEVPVRPWQGGRIIDYADWTYADGVRSLFNLCASDLVPNAPEIASNHDLQTFLKFVQQQSSLSKVDVSFGLFTGMWLGGLLALLIGCFLVRHNAPDTFRPVFLSVLAGALAGAVVGSLIEGVRQSRKVAQDLVTRAYHKYELSSDRLLTSAASFPLRVRRAVTTAVEHACE